ncbi:aminotransferase class I/II-fold pyridoxal phosphate-dependent enzyme [Bacteriovorax sp. Seq25_V]|uniref:aminotransferase class I/II-fold pyridoxal phosphate-dependent enzyme n=1 Tax=Bacteriovorax sp. Seq25_V TaxID=1201288 RepID=UPI00038A0661|nr:aminotransferase class I/II-fold pyridoxal phosphate-dependent enzyme [Bacteriovorax sp. Seq25_V]EQC43478.1 DegT/DnrJ/EryC1/StrS aminotransferase family protein [Bacteriovorax sp. Seq25_V]
MENRLYLSPPHMSGNEKKYIDLAFESNWIAPLGPNVDKFESTMNEYLGSHYAVAMTSGTAAIHIALVMLDVKPGDYVLCSSMTFVASANPVLYLGAEPVFIDSEHNSWNICPRSLEKAMQNLEKKPKALIVVDLLGQSADYGEIKKVCDKYNLPIIEDAAEALGAKYNGIKCGTFGEYGVFSFNGNKILSTSGGGMLICKTKEQALRAKHLITQAREDAPYYLHTEVGYNYRMSNIVAGLGIAQLGILEDRVNKKRFINKCYQEKLKDISYIRFMPEPEWSYSNRWLTSILVDDDSLLTPTEIISELEKNNIEARRLWKPLHSQPLFEKNKYFFDNESVCDSLFESGVSLPSGTQMTEKDIERVCNIIKNIKK